MLSRPGLGNGVALRIAALCGLFALLFALGCQMGGGHGGGGGGGNGGGGGGGQQVVAIGIQSVAPNSLTGITGAATFIVQVNNSGGKASTSTTTLTADLGNLLTIGAGSGGGGGSASWNCAASSGNKVNCTYTASIPPNSTAQPLTINVNVSSTASGSGQITFTVANPDGVAGAGANLTVNFSVFGSGGGAVGGMVMITTPEPAISSPELVVAGTANARTTAILQASVVSGDNGAGINWYVCLGDATTGACAGNEALGGNSTLGTISPSNAGSGAFVTYTAPASLPAPPDGNFVIITAQQPGTNGSLAGPMSTTTVVPYIVQTNNELLTGNFTEGANFVFRLRGFTASGSGLAYGIIGRLHVDGIGSANETSGVTNGVEDVNIVQPDGSSVVYTGVAFTGGYNMDTSSHGLMKLTVTNPPWAIAPIPTNSPPTTMTFAFTIDNQDFIAKFIEAEPAGNYVGSGIFRYQSPLAVFNSTNVSGSFVFGLATPVGTGSGGTHHGVVGRLDLATGTSSTTGTVANTSTVDDDSGNPTQTLTGGTYALDGTTADHGTLTLNIGPNTSHSTFYVADRRHVFVLGTDPDTAVNTKGVLLGEATKVSLVNNVPATFDNTSLNGPFVFTALGETTSAAANGQGHASAIIGRFSGTPGAAGAGTLTGIFDVNDGGTVPAGPLSILGSGGSSPGSFTIATDGRGRGVLNISNASGSLVTYHFVFYFVAPGRGVLQEQPASDGSRRGRSGEFLFQTINLQSIDVTIVGGTTADTSASLHSVGVFQVNGAAHPVSFTDIADASKSGSPSQVPVPGTGTGTITLTDQANGRGTVSATVGTIAGSAGAVIYIEDPAEVLVMGTDATLLEPQIITLDQ